MFSQSMRGGPTSAKTCPRLFTAAPTPKVIIQIAANILNLMELGSGASTNQPVEAQLMIFGPNPYSVITVAWR